MFHPRSLAQAKILKGKAPETPKKTKTQRRSKFTSQQLVIQKWPSRCAGPEDKPFVRARSSPEGCHFFEDPKLKASKLKTPTSNPWRRTNPFLLKMLNRGFEAHEKIEKPIKTQGKSGEIYTWTIWKHMLGNAVSSCLFQPTGQGPLCCGVVSTG